MALPTIALIYPTDASNLTVDMIHFDVKYTDTDNSIANSIIYEIDTTNTFNSINLITVTYNNISSGKTINLIQKLTNTTWYWRTTIINPSGTTVSNIYSFTVNKIFKKSLYNNEIVIFSNWQNKRSLYNNEVVIFSNWQNKRGIFNYENIIVDPNIIKQLGDEYTTLLIHCNYPIIKDINGAVITTYGNITLNTLQKKFGDASIYLDGSGDYLRIPYNSDYYGFNINDFTMDCWIYPNAMPTSDSWPTNWTNHMSIMGVGSPGASNGCNLVLGQTKLILQNNDSQIVNGIHNIAVGSWYHVAVTRNINTWRLFVNGVLVGTATNSASAGTGSYLYIGCETAEGAYFNGYIDEIRVSKGIARWTTDFIPPTREYGFFRKRKFVSII